ncbi:Hypothetical predicted protein, partial [Mytilus galloprovincialis]
IDQYIKKSLSTHFTETQSLTSGLHGSVVDEIDKFTALALPNLLFTVVNESALKTPISDIYKPDNKSFLPTVTTITGYSTVPTI